MIFISHLLLSVPFEIRKSGNNRRTQNAMLEVENDAIISKVR